MEQMLEAYAAAVRAKDVDAFLGLYADDARNFDLWNVWSYDGKAELRGMVEEWFGSLEAGEEVVVEWHEVRTQAGEDVAGLSAFLTYSTG
jgi:ketosteroid isomerase-like protein